MLLQTLLLLPCTHVFPNAQASKVKSAMDVPSEDRCLLSPKSECTRVIKSGGLGSLVWRLGCNMQRAAAGQCGVCGFDATNGCPNKPKMLLYVGHDDTAFGLLTVLRQPAPDQWPWFAWNMQLELWQLKRKPYMHHTEQILVVRVVLNGEVLRINGKSTTPLNEFVALLQPYSMTQDEHQKACWA